VDLTLAGKIALSMCTEPLYGRHGALRCVVDVALAEAAYRRHRLYLTPENDPCLWKIARFERYAACTRPDYIHAPVVLFCNTAEEGVQLRFIEGRHRFGVLRDAGVKEMIMTTWGRKSFWFGRESGIITRFVADPGYIRPVKCKVERIAA